MNATRIGQQNLPESQAELGRIQVFKAVFDMMYLILWPLTCGAIASSSPRLFTPSSLGMGIFRKYSMYSFLQYLQLQTNIHIDLCSFIGYERYVSYHDYSVALIWQYTRQIT